MVNGTDDVPFERDRDLNIYQRIHTSMTECGFLEKDKTHEIKKDGKMLGKFQYISHDDVVAAARKPFLKHGIVIVPTVLSRIQNGNRVELNVQVSFVNIDNPDDKIVSEVVGYGVDGSDKGPGKAMSYAVKYALLKLMMLNSADDIEADDTAHEPTQPTADTVNKAIARAEKSTEVAAKNLRAAIEGAATADALKKIRRDNGGIVASMPSVTRDYFEDLYEKRAAALPE